MLTVIILKMWRFFFFLNQWKKHGEQMWPTEKVRIAQHGRCNNIWHQDYWLCGCFLNTDGFRGWFYNITHNNLRKHKGALASALCIFIFLPKLNAKFSLLNIKLNVSKSLL